MFLFSFCNSPASVERIASRGAELLLLVLSAERWQFVPSESRVPSSRAEPNNAFSTFSVVLNEHASCWSAGLDLVHT